MTLPPTPAADEDKADHLNENRAEGEDVYDNLTPPPSLDPSPRPKSLAFSNGGFLSAPLTGPVRPLSPDTLSNLSFDEYEQIRPTSSVRRHERDGRLASSSPAPGPSGFRGKLHQFWIRNKGLAFMLMGQIFGCLMNVTTRLLEIEGNKGKGLHPFQILFARMGITCVLASTYMWYKSTPHFPFGMKEVRWLLVLRGIAGFAGVFGMYFSLLYLPLADATVITFLSPSLACFACSILINEPFTRIEKFASLVSVVGVILIARPTSLFTALLGSNESGPSDGDLVTGNPDAAPSNGTMAADASNYDDVTPIQRLSAVGIALIGVLGAATAYTTIRWIGKRAHPLISVNYFATGSFIVSIVMQSILPSVGFILPADLKEWGYLFFLGTCGFVMQFLLAAGLAYEKSSRATNMVYTQMLFALGFDKLIFGHTPGIMSILGSSLILGSAIVVAIQQDPKRGQANSDGVRDERGDRDGGDEESRTGLMSGADVENSEDHDRLPVQEIQLRTLR